MSIDVQQFRQMIQDTLKPVDMYSADAEELLVLTAAHESHLGKYLTQVGVDPMMGGNGVYQMEKDTEQDIHNNYLAYREDTANKVYTYMSMMGNDLKYNLAYQTIMARLHYMRVPQAIPDKEDVEGLASYWKVHYNTIKGKGSIKKAIRDYEYYVEGTNNE